MTIQDRIVAALQAQGSKVVSARTKKYIVLTRTTNQAEFPFYYVGKNGALRTGKNVAKSISVPNTAKRLLGEGN